MRSKTLSCKGLNGALIRNDFSRFWPLWAVYAVLWLFLGPLQQFLLLFGSHTQYWNEMEAISASQEQLLSISSGTGVGIAVVFGCLFAMALYSYLDNARSVGMMHSFPIRRSGLFFSHYLAGCTVFVGTLAVCALLTAAIQGAAGVLSWKNIGLWFLCMAGEMLFFYTFAVFCAMFTGQVLAVPVFYAIWNALAWIMTMMVQSLAQTFLYGYQAGSIPAWVEWMTPVGKMCKELYPVWERTANESIKLTEMHGLGVLGIYTLAALALLAGAFLLYHFRRSETAGDTVSVGWAKQVFRFGAGLCTALILGQGLYHLIVNEFLGDSGNAEKHLLLAMVCMVLLGLVGFYGAEMLLCKSFRVLKHSWKSAMVMAAAILLLGISVGLDLFGVEMRLPKADQVVSVDLRVSSGQWFETTITNEKEIQQMLAFHENLLEQKEELQQKEREQREVIQAGKTEDLDCNIYLTYLTQNGKRVEREYRLIYSQKDLENPKTLAGELNQLVQSPEVRKNALLAGTGYDSIEKLAAELTGGDYGYPLNIHEGGWEQQREPFNEEVAKDLWAALIRDIEAGHGGKILSGQKTREERYVNDLEFRFLANENTTSPTRWYYGEDRAVSFTVEFTTDYTELTAALKAHGLVTEARPLMTQSDLEKRTNTGPTSGEESATEVVYEHPDTGEQVMAMSNVTAVGTLG